MYVYTGRFTEAFFVIEKKGNSSIPQTKEGWLNIIIFIVKYCISTLNFLKNKLTHKIFVEKMYMYIHTFKM